MLNIIRKHIQNSDTILGLGLICILILIIIPLPGYILDALIALSFMSAILIILTSLASQNPANFSVFPTLLLITTIYRLALNVSTTRMILSQGDSATSSIIEVFGTFVVGGGRDAGAYIIGIIIFLILTLVQVLVITKGATRVSEVAARFALDSLPGKQLAIDSDLAAGYIDDKTARERREMLQTEMGFYGAMDGASKFVQGDVRFSLVMIAINVLGGIIVGTSIRGESFGEAVETYTRFTIGDGLVSAIPALLISSATGIIVSRSVGNESLPEDIKQQLLSNPRVLYVVGSILGISGLIPGFPFVAMFSIGGLIFFVGTRLEQSLQKDTTSGSSTDLQREGSPAENYLQHLRTESLEMEIGYSLVPLVDTATGGTLLDQISRLRRRFAMENGLILPSIRIRDNMSLEANEYVIRLQGSQIGKSSLEPDKLMAIDTGKVKREWEGEAFQEPSFHLKAYWIEADQKSNAEEAGYDVVDASTVIATHLSHLIQQHSSEIMGRREVKNILDSIREDNPVIVDEVLNESKVSLGKIQAILQSLLREGVSIRNMQRILETIADHYARTEGDTQLLCEAIRQNLGRQIVEDLVDEKKILHVISLDEETERSLGEAIHRDPVEGFVVAMHPDLHKKIGDALMRRYQDAVRQSYYPVFVSSWSTRAGLFHILERLLPARDFKVLAYEEIPSDLKLEIVGELKAETQATA